MSRPKVPTPYENASRVREFLTEFFLVLDPDRDQDDALRKAQRTHVDGHGLYEIAEEDWRAKYDIQGAIIYNEIQRSKYGYVSSRQLLIQEL